ncbi:MAG: hypothetical protein IPJ06_05180 [Saprospiraceae bacterium]|nr:hypothetical protein [Saprospiraceae bacterium]
MSFVPGTPTATDNCDQDVTITYLGENKANGSCADDYTLTRTWKAEDNCGNTKTATQKITVRDTQDPVFVNFPLDITVECHTVPDPATPGGIDNCDLNVTVTYLGEIRQDGNCEDRYVLIRTWKVEDNCGHSKTAAQTITVEDTAPPVLTCPAVFTIECSDDFTPNGAGYATSTDNCDPDPTETYTDATLDGNCPDNYKIERTWKATDRCGNISTTCLQTITIEDTTPPVVPAHLISPSSVPMTSPNGAGYATSTDNCDPDPRRRSQMRHFQATVPITTRSSGHEGHGPLWKREYDL